MRSNSSSVSVEPVSPPISGSPAGGRGESAAAPISLSLYQVERELQELLYAREQAEEEGALPAEIEAIDKAIQEYFAREVRKVDGICHALQVFKAAALTAQTEANRMQHRADNLQAQHERIKAATLRAMQDHGIRVLETPTNKLRVQANGGKEPLEITGMVPSELTDVTVKMSLDLWQEVCRELVEAPALLRLCNESRETEEPNGDRIRAALKQGQEVPGAKLLPRSFHLRVE